MKRLATLGLTLALLALTACSAELEPAEAPERPAPVEVPVDDPAEPTPVEPAPVEVPDCAAILEEATLSQDAALENELEDCLADRLTPIASASDDDEEPADDESEPDADDEGALDDLLDDLEDAGFSIPDLSACEPLLEDQDFAGFAECVSEALWEDLDLPELEDECTELLDTEGPDAFAECVGDQLGADEDLDLPLPEEGECLPLLETSLEDFAECVADELEGFLDLCEEDDEPGDEPEEPADEPDEPEEPSTDIDDLCLEELDEAELSDSDADWDAYDACLDAAVPGFGACLDILDAGDLMDDTVWDAFEACVDELP